MSALEASVTDDPSTAPAAPVAPDAPAAPDAPDAPTVASPPLSKASRLPLIVMAVATLASVLSVTGLLVASRTIARATLAIEALEANDRAAAAPDRQAIAPLTEGPAPVPTEVASAIDRLRVDLARRPVAASSKDGDAVQLMRDGQGELADRISAVSAQVERLERTLSASRKARP